MFHIWTRLWYLSVFSYHLANSMKFQTFLREFSIHHTFYNFIIRILHTPCTQKPDKCRHSMTPSSEHADFWRKLHQTNILLFLLPKSGTPKWLIMLQDSMSISVTFIQLISLPFTDGNTQQQRWNKNRNEKRFKWQSVWRISAMTWPTGGIVKFWYGRQD